MVNCLLHDGAWQRPRLARGSLAGATMKNSSLKTLIEPLRTHLVFVAIFSAFYNILFLAPSLYMMQVYDRVLATGGMNTLALLSVLLLAALATLKRRVYQPFAA